MASLAELRKKLLEKNNKEQQASNDNAIYPFWNIPENTPAYLRFLPDGDPSNDFFWVERQMIRLPFAGVKGQSSEKEVTVQVPCMEMWNETCPVLTEVRPWFKDSELEDLARKYWKKRSYIFQGFVREDPLEEKDPPENPIRRFVINPTVFKIIHDALMDPDMEEIPTDYHAGSDFKIVKTKQGQYSSYTTSNYARKTSPLTEDEMAAIEEYGLFNLNDFLPKKPDSKGVEIIAEMFEASYNGEVYDPDKWGQYFRPFGLNVDSSNNSNNSNASVQTKPAAKASEEESSKVESNDSVSTENKEEDTPPWDEGSKSVDEDEQPNPQASSNDGGEEKRSPQDIINQIKQRKSSASE